MWGSSRCMHPFFFFFFFFVLVDVLTFFFFVLLQLRADCLRAVASRRAELLERARRGGGRQAVCEAVSLSAPPPRGSLGPAACAPPPHRSLTPAEYESLMRDLERSLLEGSSEADAEEAELYARMLEREVELEEAEAAASLEARERGGGVPCPACGVGMLEEEADQRVAEEAESSQGKEDDRVGAASGPLGKGPSGTGACLAHLGADAGHDDAPPPASQQAPPACISSPSPPRHRAPHLSRGDSSAAAELPRGTPLATCRACGLVLAPFHPLPGGAPPAPPGPRPGPVEAARAAIGAALDRYAIAGLPGAPSFQIRNRDDLHGAQMVYVRCDATGAEEAAALDWGANTAAP